MKVLEGLVTGGKGSYGQSTWSKNAAGFYVKAKPIPTNRNSLAQLAARGIMRSVMGSYALLDEIQKASWQAFSLATFNPLHNTNSGQYTGHQSYVGLQMGARGSESRRVNGDMKNLGGVGSLCSTWTGYTPSNDPPIVTIRPNILDGVIGVYNLEFSVVSLTSAGVLNFEIDFQGILPGGLSVNKLEDENGTPFAFNIYCSDVVAASGMRPKNDFLQNLGSTGFPTLGSPGIIHKTGFRIQYDASSLIAKLTSFPAIGNVVKITCVNSCEFGTMSIVGAAYITVT